jgi:hypothetical protein
MVEIFQGASSSLGSGFKNDWLEKGAFAVKARFFPWLSVQTNI